MDRLFKITFWEKENIIEYLGRYTHKIAISNHRILSIDTQNKRVTFSMKDYRKKGKKTTITLATKDFIKRFQNHILPKGFTRIRHYGYLSSSWKKEKLPRLQVLLADKEKETIEFFVAVEKSKHRICPICKTGELITLLIFDNKGPPENYRQIAKHKILKYII